MKTGYEPKTCYESLAHLVEECGEVVQAAGKSLRFGVECYNPELPAEQRELNGAWVLRELGDLKLAIARAEESVALEMDRLACSVASRAGDGEGATP